jgi:hypothetical protein
MFEIVWIPDTNRGYQLLSTMGWSEGRGLGANEQGTTTPVRTHLKLNRAGIGHGEMGKSRVTHFPAHDERQQQTSADGLSDAQRMQERLMRKRSSELDKLTKAERKARQLKDQRKEQKIGRELYAPHLEGYEEYFQ